MQQGCRVMMWVVEWLTLSIKRGEKKPTWQLHGWSKFWITGSTSCQADILWHPDKYDEAVTFLYVIETFKGLKVGKKDDDMPIQTGVILATTWVLSIAYELFRAGYALLLTSRLTQDCLENLFSSVRLRKPVPTPLEFKYALKLISNTQFLTLPRSGSYQQDDGEFLADFLEQPVKVPAEPPAIVIHLSEERSPSTQELPQAERDNPVQSGRVLFAQHHT